MGIVAEQGGYCQFHMTKGNLLSKIAAMFVQTQSVEDLESCVYRYEGSLTFEDLSASARRQGLGAFKLVGSEDWIPENWDDET